MSNIFAQYEVYSGAILGNIGEKTMKKEGFFGGGGGFFLTGCALPKKTSRPRRASSNAQEIKNQLLLEHVWRWCFGSENG